MGPLTKVSFGIFVGGFPRRPLCDGKHVQETSWVTPLGVL
jgi:hypothetical protein